MIIPTVGSRYPIFLPVWLLGLASPNLGTFSEAHLEALGRPVVVDVHLGDGLGLLPLREGLLVVAPRGVGLAELRVRDRELRDLGRAELFRPADASGKI